MNVYDFDGTIYDGDSTVDFYKYCLNRYPTTRLAIFSAIRGAFLYLFDRIDKTKFKEYFFLFVHCIPDTDEAVAAFWREHEGKIKVWYLAQKQDSDIIISASPEFLLAPICEKLCVTLIGSRVDKGSGIFDGANCYGLEKVRRLAAVVDSSAASAFYTDSLTDKPLADKIPNAFIVKGNKLTPWCGYRPSVFSKLKHEFFTPEFFLFAFCGGCGTIVNFCFSILFAQGINSTLAYVGGYAVSLLAAYALNSLLLFKTQLSIKGFIKFVISYIPNFIILFMFVAVLLNMFHLWEVIVYLSAAILGLPITFIIVKLFAFNKTKEPS